MYSATNVPQTRVPPCHPHPHVARPRRCCVSVSPVAAGKVATLMLVLDILDASADSSSLSQTIETMSWHRVCSLHSILARGGFHGPDGKQF